jgi:ribonuclease R
MTDVFVAEIVEGSGGLAASNPFVTAPPQPIPLILGATETGDFAEVEARDGVARVRRLIAPAGSARARLYQLLAERHIDPTHPQDVATEVRWWLARTGIDDPALEDMTSIPFVTVDGYGTRDLDQALAVTRGADGFLVRYALADASYYVRPGSALFREALRRGASYYLPGLSAPMLPRALSEGLISLNPRVDRRATVFEMELDVDGEVVSCRVTRARVHSRARLHFDQVQDFLDGRPGHAISEPEVIENLRRFEEVGQLRLAHAHERNMVPYRTAETRVHLADGSGMAFVAIERMRNRVERYGEQLSLMCNIEGAALLRRAANENTQPIYRTHAPPDERRLDELEARIAGVVQAYGLSDAWMWDRSTHTLGEYIRRLPGDADREHLRQALQHQAIMVNVRSTFTAEPGPHFGLGADAYARFSAPMREIVGVFVHKELWDLLDGRPPSSDEALRDAVIEAATGPSGFSGT